MKLVLFLLCAVLFASSMAFDKAGINNLVKSEARFDAQADLLAKASKAVEKSAPDAQRKLKKVDQASLKRLSTLQVKVHALGVCALRIFFSMFRNRLLNVWERSA